MVGSRNSAVLDLGICNSFLVPALLIRTNERIMSFMS